MMKEELYKLIPTCCEVDFLNYSDCSKEEQILMREILPSTNTVIVLAHNVKTSLEWAWFPLESERGNNTCGADLHTQNVLLKMQQLLISNGYSTGFLPYPGRCGIRMKDLAAKTDMGEIGDNYLFLHSKWGPWTHLRVLLTDAVIASERKMKASVCTHCSKCISACPSKAVKKDFFDGIVCGNYQDTTWNGVKDNYYWKCEECARACPVGNAPLLLKIREGDNIE